MKLQIEKLTLNLLTKIMTMDDITNLIFTDSLYLCFHGYTVVDNLYLENNSKTKFS